MINPKRPVSKQSFRFENSTCAVPTRTNICIDGSCNLWCDSCRGEMRFAKGEELRELEYMADNLLDSSWLNQKHGTLQLSGWGEVFFSKVYRRILFDAKNNVENIQILSNGTLFTPEIFDKLINKYGFIRVISISIDAASEDTYKKLRRGGNWSMLMRNMEYISEQHIQKKVGFFEISMVVQRENYMEIPAFAELGIRWGVDKISFAPMRHFNSSLSEERYREKSMIAKDGMDFNSELKEIFRSPILEDSRVSYDWFRQRM